ncbi:hypothetical protein FACS189442_4760 [Spirochaetia bacterium]|nr:hypothetical protein FACS189442_4760 [Spirochaetia bacterium]
MTVADAELGIPLEGAVIHLPESQQYVCDESGTALIMAPDNRAVLVQIIYPGYETGRLTIPLSENSFLVHLRPEGVPENQELVIRGSASQNTGSGRAGRSVAIAGETLRRTAEMGIFEDVMSAVKLLPGVGYGGMFDSKPSIRGGEGDELTAVFDGFYVENPYHWDGKMSIFDPEMVSSAKLSHGVFSARYGHTVSGLLEVASKKPDPVDAEFDVGFSTLSLKARLSIPFAGKGGIQAAGNALWMQTVVDVAKNFTDSVRYLDIAPYVLNSAFSGNYRFNNALELSLSGFIGLDGMNNDISGDIWGFSTGQGFVTAGALWNPAANMVLRGRFGAGFLDYKLDSEKTDYNIPVRTGSEAFRNTTGNYQARIDFDWDIGHDLLVSFGAEERYSRYSTKKDTLLTINYPDNTSDSFSDVFNIANQTSFLSAWTLLEYTGRKFGGELGLRLDHLYYIGKDFTIQTMPVFSPRLNIDWNIIRGRGYIDSLSLTAGTGIFSGMLHSNPNKTENINYISKESRVNDYDLKMAKSWTSVAGLNLEFMEQYRGTLEFYYKYIFDRLYTEDNRYFFDGEGRSFGFDFMLQKASGRFWDGWFSYSFNWVQNRNPSSPPDSKTDWYYPEFHRFHNLNLIVNINPAPSFTTMVHFGYASGVPTRIGTDRGDDVLTLDLKFSWRWNSPGRKALIEFYAAVENIWALFKNESLEDIIKKITDGDAMYQLPIPVPSIGFRISY